MSKIIVTVEQAKIIERYKNYKGDMTLGYRVYLISIETAIDLVTIARIVEGEPYEIKREYSVGDIVEGNISKRIYEITEIVSPNYVRCVVKGSTYGFNPDQFTLICKAENREDLRQ